ncbi:hypothetical protein IV60_GL001055 [Lancefieldella rimae]|uniref:Uncharacterized protein n=1 Tax=Lancefieldella rimae TaxID=1383 RepID=A0ABR5PZ48_9ACTN|nr:hypothetical protein IV60_GL001055 [Lancefieldella rimae]
MRSRISFTPRPRSEQQLTSGGSSSSANVYPAPQSATSMITRSAYAATVVKIPPSQVWSAALPMASPTASFKSNLASLENGTLASSSSSLVRAVQSAVGSTRKVVCQSGCTRGSNGAICSRAPTRATGIKSTKRIRDSPRNTGCDTLVKLISPPIAQIRRRAHIIKLIPAEST